MKTGLALVVVLAVALPAWAQSAAPPRTPAAPKPPAASKQPPPAKPHAAKLDPQAVLQAMEEAFSSVADRVTPAVINVSTTPKRSTGSDEQRFRDVRRRVLRSVWPRP